ncbi:MAG: tRNA pseudouridine(38-40) synthase TruA [Bdellovibrionales bacterium]|nr:tRNA pseudouridine(38-40) synthase TruA [Bdellovibrionales bacterium]
MAQSFAARVSYIGTQYCGWQHQAHTHPRGLRSIQEIFQEVLLKMCGETLIVHASGRTDAGVHAVAQVIHFKLSRRLWEPDILVRGMNTMLPPDIRVLRVVEVPESFHSQFDAVKKQYGYYILQGHTELPHLTPLVYWKRRLLDVAKMEEAVAALQGEHDFAPFQAADGKRKTTVRKLYVARLLRLPVTFPGAAEAWGEGEGTGLPGFQLLKVELVGSGFLKQMVRSIAGTLLEIGDGRRPASAFRDILQSGKRTDVGVTAPARGLWLERVWYPEPVDI